ncbi:MAG: TonB family protein [Caulobacter sp.]|nr:TonB family protein [Caulobacter sp.]
MHRLVLVALLVFASAAVAVAQTSDADWLRKPTGDQLRAAWPARALAAGRGGSAIITCEINIRGGLENCRIESEKPAGEGFGDAALLLVPSFLMKPAMEDGKPVRSVIRIPIAFASGGSGGNSGPTISMVTNPPWRTAPSFADMAAAWPKGAEAIQQGHVSMRCKFKKDGGLTNCETLTENPRGRGFGGAARKLAALFAIPVDPQDPHVLDRTYVNLQIRFINPAAPEALKRAVVQPRWIRGPDPAKVLAIYPEQAVAAGVKTGLGVAECTIATDGALTDCAVAREDPPGLGFGQAAVAVAVVMRMSPWTEDGGPVDGGKIKLPVRFNKAPDPAPAAP